MLFLFGSLREISVSEDKFMKFPEPAKRAGFRGGTKQERKGPYQPGSQHEVYRYRSKAVSHMQNGCDQV